MKLLIYMIYGALAGWSLKQITLLVARNVVLDFDEMKNAMTNAHLQINSHDLSDEADSLTEAFEDYKFIADTVIGKGAIPCSHYVNTGLYKNTCDWCKAVQTYKALERAT